MFVEGEKGRLTERGYEQLRRACKTHREELVLRLCGEAGLRAGEIARLKPSDVTGEDGGTSMQYLVTVREADDGSRTAYLPSGVAHDFWQYVRSNPIGSNDEVIDVTERRIQMLIGEICERTAAKTGHTALENVTPSTLRQFFAQQLLVEDGVDARVVSTVGGWEGIDGVLDPLSPPSKEEIGAAFERVETDETGTGRLSRIVNTVEQTITAIVDANSREEIEREVCTSLVEEQYAAAWVLTKDRQRDKVVVSTHAGESANRFEGAADTSIVRRALQTGQSFVAPDDPGPATEQEGKGLLAAAPLSHGETQYGALVVRAKAPDAFDDSERTVLTTLGRQIGFAIAFIERKQVLAGGAVLEVRFQYSDSEATMVGLANALDCTISLDGAVAGDEGLLCFIRVRGISAKAALEAGGDLNGIESARLIRTDEESGLLEIVLGGRSPLLLLVERGATITELIVEDGQATLTCELSPEVDLRRIHDELHDEFPSVELRSKREKQATTDSLRTTESLEKQLTEKQCAVLRTAYHAGYFEWPRGSTAEDLAESMDVSSPTLHNHLRKAQQNILENILETE